MYVSLNIYTNNQNKKTNEIFLNTLAFNSQTLEYKKREKMHDDFKYVFPEGLTEYEFSQQCFITQNMETCDDLLEMHLDECFSNAYPNMKEIHIKVKTNDFTHDF